MRHSSAHAPSSGRSSGCFENPGSDENASYRPRALLYQDNDCIVPEEDYTVEWAYGAEQCKRRQRQHPSSVPPQGFQQPLYRRVLRPISVPSPSYEEVFQGPGRRLLPQRQQIPPQHKRLLFELVQQVHLRCTNKVQVLWLHISALDRHRMGLFTKWILLRRSTSRRVQELYRQKFIERFHGRGMFHGGMLHNNGGTIIIQ